MLNKHKRKLDKMWSEKVKEEADFKCEICGNRERLNAHHHIGRRSLTTRWWLPNGISLCPGCHTFSLQSAHQNPEHFRSEIIKVRGNKWLKELMIRGNKTVKPVYETVLAYLKGERNDY